MRRLVAALLAAIAVMLLGASAIAGANPAPPTVAEQVEAPGTSVDTPPTQADVEAETPDSPDDLPDIPAEEPVEVLLVGGSGNDEAKDVEHFINGSLIPAGANVTRVHILADLWPAFGGPDGATLDESRATSIPIVDEAIRTAVATGRRVLVIPYSQAGSTVSLTFQRLQINGADLSKVTVAYISSSRTIGTGFEARFPWLRLPVGITSTGAAWNVVNGVDFCVDGDPICNMPCRLDLVNLLNALIGYFRLHPDYYQIDLTGASIYSQDGIVYVTIRSNTVPLIDQLHEWGINNSLLDAWIKDRVEMAPQHGPRGTCPAALSPLAILGIG